MALSDQLNDLAVKAKQVEDRVAAAKQKTKADLEGDVDNARASAQAQADALHAKAEANKGKISAWWDKMETVVARARGRGAQRRRGKKGLPRRQGGPAGGRAG